MKFINRSAELQRFDRLLGTGTGELGILWGRRRIGKTRLLLEWCRTHAGLYTVADLSAPAIQRRYLAQAVAAQLPGFSEVEYPDWRALLERLARDCRAQHWRGPIVFDELPYWVTVSPELPSVLQRWLDHEAKTAELVIVLAGSSQHMMHGLALAATAPLYGRARETLALAPLGAGHIREALHLADSTSGVEAYAVWGGVPRYWELAQPYGNDLAAALDACVLDPAGPLHAEPDRLLVEELPSAQALRPILDAIGLGAHKLTEVAGRLGRPPTALSRALVRLQELGLVERQIPFGESERSGKRALYRIADPFFRTWFRLVAPHQAFLASARPAQRRTLWRKHGPGLVAAAWEDLCRAAVAQLTLTEETGQLGPWLPARRYWHGNTPEWDVVSRSVDGRHLLLGEVKWQVGKGSLATLRQAAAELLRKPAPSLPECARARIVRVLFMPDAPPGRLQDVHIINAQQVLDASYDVG